MNKLDEQETEENFDNHWKIAYSYLSAFAFSAAFEMGLHTPLNVILTYEIILFWLVMSIPLSWAFYPIIELSWDWGKIKNTDEY